MHVRKGNGEAVFDVESEAELRESAGLKVRELARAEELACENRALASGLELAFPVEGNPRLEGKSHEHLDQIELLPYGLHWPALDEDLSIRGILSGRFGQRPHQAA